MNIKDNNINKINTDKILIELIKNQKKIVPVDKKLLLNDLKRISKYLTKSIFNDDCSIWTGYVTIIKNDKKNSYVNFYYCGKKYALHRLLYQNFIGELLDSEYIKFNCANKGKCCNINHFYKINKDDTIQEEKNESTESIESNKVNDLNNKNIQKNIIVDFNL